MRFIILIIFSISCISLLDATERKQPGVKYTDTLKQKRADKAASEGRVVPKQPGVNYNDTRSQTENNLTGNNTKIPGQSYSSTLKGTAESKSDGSQNRERIEKDRKVMEKLKDEIKQMVERGEVFENDPEFIERLKQDRLLYDEFIYLKKFKIKIYGRDEFKNDDEIWGYVFEKEFARIYYSSFNPENYYNEVLSNKVSENLEFWLEFRFPMTMDYNLARRPLELPYRNLIKKLGNNKEAKDKAQEIIKTKITIMYLNHLQAIQAYEKENNKPYEKTYSWRQNLYEMFDDKLGFENFWSEFETNLYKYKGKQWQPNIKKKYRECVIELVSKEDLIFKEAEDRCEKS